MKTNLGPAKPAYLTPVFGGDEHAQINEELKARMRRPMRVGAGVIGVFVIGLGLWAAVTPLSTGVSAPAEVRVESNRKTLRHRDGGVVKQILVKEGQLVKAGQTLLTFNDVEAKAAYDVYRNQLDTLLAQTARYEAESAGRSTLTFPSEVTERLSDPRISGLIRDQQLLFESRLQLYQNQLSILGQRADQVTNQIAGLQAQIDSVSEQRSLTQEELAGYQKLNEQGYAPKTLILRYQRQIADLDGRAGQLRAEVARMGQIIGETKMQAASLREQRQTEAAEGLRDAQSKLSDVGPRFAAASQALQQTVVKSPADGYVFNLTQFTVGGATAPGERLMDVVPSNAPMIVAAMIKPEDVDKVYPGMDARVRLTGLNQRFHDPMPGKVTVVSADRLVDEKSGIGSYRVEIQVDPKELTKVSKDVQLTSGMPAQAMLVTGERTVLGYLIQPITDTLQDAFHEQ